jgi:hypothetical protein
MTYVSPTTNSCERFSATPKLLLLKTILNMKLLYDCDYFAIWDTPDFFEAGPLKLSTGSEGCCIED